MALKGNKVSAEQLALFQILVRTFEDNGFSLYLVGGTVRDYLLNIDLTDMDLVTDATPEDMKKFLGEADYTFERFGSVKLKFRKHKFDITTMRKESSYSDSRHPNQVVFSTSLKEDVKRRDFTVNALYMDKHYKVIDYVKGQKDLKKNILKTVGEADLRLKEDPLRIVRAYRFQINYGFIFDKELEDAIQNNIDLVKNINKDKIRQEIEKCHDEEKLIECLKHFNVL